MFKLKPLSKEAISRSLDKAEHYRLLNEPRVAESICNDVLQIDPANQRAHIILILAITDQFNMSSPAGLKQALILISGVENEYDQAYYTGIIYERQAKAKLSQHYPESEYNAYDLLREAMNWFEKAEALHPAGNEDAILRWNTCARIIMEQKLKPRPQEDFKPYLE